MPDPASGGEPLRTLDELRAEVGELRRSRRRVVEAADADRQALERALHDGVQQRLIAVAVDLQRLERLSETDPASAKRAIGEIRASVRDAIAEAAELAQRLYPPIPGPSALAPALRSAAGRAGITAFVHVDVTAAYTPAVLTTMYWCWVETTSSAPSGSHAKIDVRDGEAGLTFTIVASGSIPEERLAAFRDRIGAFGGSLTVDHLEHGASRVQGTLPPSG